MIVQLPWCHWGWRWGGYGQCGNNDHIAIVTIWWLWCPCKHSEDKDNVRRGWTIGPRRIAHLKEVQRVWLSWRSKQWHKAMPMMIRSILGMLEQAYQWNGHKMLDYKFIGLTQWGVKGYWECLGMLRCCQWCWIYWNRLWMWWKQWQCQKNGCVMSS